MTTDLNQTVVDFEKLVGDLEKDKNDLVTELANVKNELATKVAELEAKLLTPENEKKLQDLLSRLKSLLPHTA